MSDDHADHKPYSQLAINAWVILSIIVTLALSGIYIFGTQLLHVGNWVWDLLRYLARPII